MAATTAALTEDRDPQATRRIKVAHAHWSAQGWTKEQPPGVETPPGPYAANGRRSEDSGWKLQGPVRRGGYPLVAVRVASFARIWPLGVRRGRVGRGRAALAERTVAWRDDAAAGGPLSVVRCRMQFLQSPQGWRTDPRRLIHQARNLIQKRCSEWLSNNKCSVGIRALLLVLLIHLVVDTNSCSCE